MGTTFKDWLLDPVIQRVLMVVVGSVVVIVAFRLFAAYLSTRVHDTDTRYRTRKIISALQYLTVVFVTAVVFKDQLGGLTVAFGVAGAGIAFALQEVIVSIAGWAAVSFGSYYRVGDRIELGGVVGDVIDIGMLRTTLMECGGWVRGDLYNGRIVRVANSYVFKDPVVNYSADFAFLWDELEIPVTLDSDLAHARTIIDETLEQTVGDYAAGAENAWKLMVTKYRIEDARVRPLVTMGFNENWAVFTARYIVDFQRRRITKDLLSTEILDRFRASEGRVSIAFGTLAITDFPRLTVDTGNSGSNPSKTPIDPLDTRS